MSPLNNTAKSKKKRKHSAFLKQLRLINTMISPNPSSLHTGWVFTSEDRFERRAKLVLCRLSPTYRNALTECRT